jgi:CHAT domain-containing protein
MEKNSFVLVITNDIVDIIRLSATPKMLDSLISKLISPFHNVKNNNIKQLKFNADIAYLLYQKLILPVEEKTILPNRLLIIPDLAIINLPFDLLLVNTQKKTEYTPFDEPTYKNDFLVNFYSISYSPNVSILTTKSKNYKKNNNILVVANPFNYKTSSIFNSRNNNLRNGLKFEPLPYSEIEAQEIKKIVPNATIYKRKYASKNKIIEIAQNYDIIHFATHAFADSSYGAFSGIVLAVGNDSSDDGILMGFEIPDYNFKSDLITLSACETGQGKLVAGEGILGLPRSFLTAGAKTVMMTLWKVDDKMSSTFMPSFYNNYLNKNISKADALTASKRMILNEKTSENGMFYQHPFFWASFIIYGDPGISNINWFILLKSNYYIFITMVITVLYFIYKKLSFNSKKQ